MGKIDRCTENTKMYVRNAQKNTNLKFDKLTNPSLQQECLVVSKFWIMI